MSKGYTKQEVEDWHNWANKKTDQVAKDGETYEYELFLTHEDGTGFIVDCREDIVKDDDVVSSEYAEGFIFDNYSEAEKKLKEIEEQRGTDHTSQYKETSTYVAQVTVSVDAYDGLITAGLGYSEFFGNFSWGRIDMGARSSPKAFTAYTNNGFTGLSTSAVISRVTPLRSKDYTS